MMVPMMMVHTICDEEKYGARRRLAPSSTAITDMPDRNAVRYRKALLRRMGGIGRTPACVGPACGDCVFVEDEVGSLLGIVRFYGRAPLASST